MSLVKKAVIPAAGLGTRFLPATKTVPKELLPIVDKPALLYIVEEAVSAGIEDIVIISGRGKTAIEDFFDSSYELEDLLEKQGKTELLQSIKTVKDKANIISVRQKEALGLGHAVACAQPVVGNETFAVLLGDEITVAEDGKNSPLSQLVESYKLTEASHTSVIEVPETEVHKYGVVEATAVEDKKFANPTYKVKSVVEKPTANEAPSRLAIPGRYIFTADIFTHLKNAKPGKNGEIQLTDAMTGVAQEKGLYASVTTGQRFDTGDKLGFLKANVAFALQHPEVKNDFANYLKKLSETL